MVYFLDFSFDSLKIVDMDHVDNNIQVNKMDKVTFVVNNNKDVKLYKHVSADSNLLIMEQHIQKVTLLFETYFQDVFNVCDSNNNIFYNNMGNPFISSERNMLT